MTHQPPARRPRLTPLQFAVLIVILLAAALFRFAQIAGPSLWMDEIWSIEMAMGHGSAHDHLPAAVIRYDQPDLTGLADAAPWWGICTHLSGVTHPPLYFIILRWWIDVFGVSAASVRTLSALFSLAMIVAFFDLCRFLHGTKLALFAASIAATAVMQIEFAQDARSYTMLMFFGLSAADAVVRIQFLGVNRRRLIALSFFAIATALTHYLSAGALAALAIYAGVRLPARARWQTLAAFGAAGLVCLAVWIPLFASQRNTLPSLTPTFLREARVSDHLKLTVYRIIGLPAEFLLGETGGNAFARAAPYIVLAIFIFTLAIPIFRLRTRSDLLLWVLWGLGTIGFVAAVDLLHASTLVGYPRYTVLASPAIYAVIAAFDWPRIRILRHVLAIVFIAVLADAAIRRCMTPIPAKNDWRRLAEEINSAAAPDDLLVFSNPDPWVSSGTWYMGLRYYTPSFAHPWLILNDPPDPDLLKQLRSRDRLWLIGIGPEVLAPRLLPGWREQLRITSTAGVACRLVPGDESPPP